MGLEIFSQGNYTVCFPNVGQSHRIAGFFRQQDPVRSQLPADAAHHLPDAVDRVRFIHAQADGIVH